jgi:outer membrane protein assembly factor BamA
MPRRLLPVGVLMALMSAGLLIHPANAGEKPAPKESTTDASPSAGHVRISDVIIQGSRRMSAEQIKKRLRTQVGKEFKPADLDDDVRDLYKTHQFSNIQTQTEPDSSDRVTVYLLLRDLPNLVQKVTFAGAKHLKEDELRTLTGVRPGMPLNPNLNRAGCQKILEKYEEMGRPFASCELIKGGQLGDTEVVYRITEGPKAVIRDIRFTGNSFVSAAQLTTKIHSARRWLHSYCGGKYDPRTAEADVNDLIKFYKAFGYQDVRVSLETKRDPEGGEVTLIFHIQEGPRYRISRETDIIAPKGFSAKRLQGLLQMKKGDYLTEAAIKDDLRRIKDYCEARHHPVQVKPNFVWETSKPGLDCVQYEIEEKTPEGEQEASEPSSQEPQSRNSSEASPKHIAVANKSKAPPPARIGQIILTGNKRISSESILAHVPLFPGQVLTYPDLQKAENALAELDLFVVDPVAGVRPTITVLDSEGSSYKDILITVKEKRIIGKPR